jgi:hypothetical protein
MESSTWGVPRKTTPPSPGLGDAVEQLLALERGLGVVDDLDVVQHDVVGARARHLAGDADGLDGGRVGGLAPADVELDVGVPVALRGVRLEVAKRGEVGDEALREDGEGVGPVLGRGDDEDLEFGVAGQEPADEGAGDPALADAAERLDADAPAALLEVAGDVILHRRGLGEPELRPAVRQEHREVSLDRHGVLIRTGGPAGGRPPSRKPGAGAGWPPPARGSVS